MSQRLKTINQSSTHSVEFQNLGIYVQIHYARCECAQAPILTLNPAKRPNLRYAMQPPTPC
jgi:hypothetical protein